MPLIPLFFASPCIYPKKLQFAAYGQFVLVLSTSPVEINSKNGFLTPLFLCLKKILYKHQYSFRSQNSTAHPLLNISNYASVVICKAFFVIAHDILILKLSKLGLRGDNLTSHLKESSQIVSYRTVSTLASPFY